MSTNTYAVCWERKQVFDLGNHSTPLIPRDQASVVYNRQQLGDAIDNVRRVKRISGWIYYGVDESGKRATLLCVSWMARSGISEVEVVKEGCGEPWCLSDGPLSPEWTYFTPFSNPNVVPDPYTRRGEVPYRPMI